MSSIRTRQFAAKIRALRTSLELNQIELEKAAGLPRYRIYALERAEKEPSLDELCNLATALKVPAGYLVEL